MLGAIPAALTAIFVGEAVYFHAARGQPATRRAVGAEFGLWVANFAWVPAVLLVLVALPLLFPTGRPPTPRWRIVGWAAVAGGVLLCRRHRVPARPARELPVGRQPVRRRVDARLRQLGRLRAVVRRRRSPAVASIVVRFRRSHGVERQQLKWFTTAAALLVLGFVLSFSLAS